MFLSVMIPVYNKSEYLDECMSSIVLDGMEDMEIIVVDDGSTDDSLSILKKWADKDERIKVYHKENGGVASARSLALSKAKGEYIINCDPDDWVEPGIYSELKSKAQETNADVVMFDFFRNCADGTQITNQFKIDCSSSLHCRSTFISVLRILNFSTCNKMIRRKIVAENNIDYVHGIDVGEDFLFLAKVFLAMPQNGICVKIDKALYHYRETPGGNSLTQRVSYKSLLGHEKLLKWRLTNMNMPEFANLNCRAICHFVYLMIRCEDCSNQYAIKFKKEYLHFNVFKGTDVSMKWIVAIIFKLFGYRFTRKFFKIIKK